MNRMERANEVVEEILKMGNLTDAEFEEVMKLVLRKGKETIKEASRKNGKCNLFIEICQSEISFPIIKLNGFSYDKIHALGDAYMFPDSNLDSITLVIEK